MRLPQNAEALKFGEVWLDQVGTDVARVLHPELLSQLDVEDAGLVVDLTD